MSIYTPEPWRGTYAWRIQHRNREFTHDLRSADGARVALDVPLPHGHRVPLLQREHRPTGRLALLLGLSIFFYFVFVHCSSENAVSFNSYTPLESHRKATPASGAPPTYIIQGACRTRTRIATFCTPVGTSELYLDFSFRYVCQSQATLILSRLGSSAIRL